MAASLIDSMTSDFDPDAHHDGYREALVEVVDAKIQGRELTQPGALEIAAAPSTSLADALKASLAAAQQPSGAGESGPKAKAIGDGAAKSGSTRSRATKAGTSKARAGKAGPDETGQDQEEPPKGKAGGGKAGAGRSGAKSGPARPTRRAS